MEGEDHNMSSQEDIEGDIAKSVNESGDDKKHDVVVSNKSKSRSSSWPAQLINIYDEALMSFVPVTAMIKCLDSLKAVFASDDGGYIDEAKSPHNVLNQLLLYGYVKPFDRANMKQIATIKADRYSVGKPRERKDDEQTYFGVDNSDNVSRYVNMSLTYIMASNVETDVITMKGRVSFRIREGLKSQRYLSGYISVGFPGDNLKALAEVVKAKCGYRSVMIKSQSVESERYAYISAKLLDGKTDMQRAQVNFDGENGVERATPKEFAQFLVDGGSHFMWECVIIAQLTGIIIVPKTEAAGAVINNEHDCMLDIRVKVINALTECSTRIGGTDGQYINSISWGSDKIKLARIGMFAN